MKNTNKWSSKCTCANPKHHAKWILNERGIIKSIEAVLKSGDINKLTRDTYDFLNQMSGFIAHYNHGGFMSYYANTEDLRRDIMNSEDISDYQRYTHDSYFAQNEQASYYAQKANVLATLAVLCQKYAVTSKDNEAEKIKDKYAVLSALVSKSQTLEEKKDLLAKLELI